MKDSARAPTGHPWWKTATAYQVYPRSFCDSNGDGIGDIPGIISRLDHLRDLGIGFIWLSPVYGSPMVDNGYDIADYRAIAGDFGTMDDMDRLIAEARDRDIRIVMDLVVNHCSSEHAWFRTALHDTTAPEHDFFIWRKPAPDGGPPSTLRSYFGGSMWEYVPDLDLYYLHQFAPEQPDLNWQNPALRREIYDMMNWWFDRGIGGFRMDVIDLIGKDPDRGIFADGPDLHRFLQEMHRETMTGRDVVTVGEAWSVTPETALLYCGEGRDELDMVFQFDHVKVGWHPEHGKWQTVPLDLAELKDAFFTWQEALAGDGWNSLFLSNHDLPRQVSKYADDGVHRVRSAKMLALVIHMMRGTPYIYQGEEIGMTNMAFAGLEDFKDVETLGHYSDAMAAGLSEADFLEGANANSRDNARTPMQWSDAPQAGFTSGEPWLPVNPNHATVNVAADRADPHGIFAFYQRLVHLRRTLAIVTDGVFVPVSREHPAIFAYAREAEGQRLSVLANFSGGLVEYDVPTGLAVTGDCLAANLTPRGELGGRIALEPYEACAVLGPVA